MARISVADSFTSYKHKQKDGKKKKEGGWGRKKEKRRKKRKRVIGEIYTVREKG